MNEESRMEERKRRREIRRRRKRALMARVARHHKKLLIVIAVLILALDVLGLVKKDVDFSDTENRAMAQAPDLSRESLLDGSFASGADAYITDQFFARNFWVRMKLAMDRATGKKEVNGVYLGSSGYLMEVPKSPDPVWFDKNLDAINAFAAKHDDLNLYMCVVPNAAYVLTDYAPKAAPIRDQSKDIEAITSKLNRQVVFLDVTEAMREHQTEGIYYRTDHHWTSRGARFAFEAMAPRMDIKDIAPDYDIYTVADDFSGTMASKTGSYGQVDQVQIYVPKKVTNDFMVTYPDNGGESCSMYSSAALEARDKYTVFFGGNYSMIDIKTVNNNKRVLLLIKDSYANSFVQFLTPYFEHIIMVDPRYYYEDIEQVITKEKVTDVLFLYNMNTYLEDRSLADTLSDGS